MLNNQKGITLVALVVTIVVLIILATISISVAFQGGLIDRANEAAKYQANAEAQYKQVEKDTDNYLNSVLANVTYTPAP